MIDLKRIRRIAFLTGAGISADSGLCTYGGEASSSIDYAAMAKISSVETLQANPEVVLNYYSNFRREIVARKPNLGHQIVAQLEDRFEVIVITQNIDGYHQDAGSTEVIELHGSVRNLRCNDQSCGFRTAFREDLHHCPNCGKPIRPDIVLFGEFIGTNLLKARKAIRECDLFVSVGTSGIVYPAANLVDEAQMFEAETVHINVEETDNICFNHQILSGATEGLAQLFRGFYVQD